MTDETRETFVTEIRPQADWLDLRLKELWRYRDLTLLLIRRDLIAQYKQTILGPAWHVIQPLLMTVMFTIVFGRIARIPTDRIPPFMFYLSGNVMWSYFSTIVTKTSNTFIANAGVFGKIYFPRLASPVSVTISSLVAFGVQFLVFVGFLLYFLLTGSPVHPNGWIAATPVVVLLMGTIGLGSGILISSMTTRYRDLVNLVSFGVNLLMYATPIVYPLSTVPEAYRPFVLANPMTPLIESFRYAFLGAGTVTTGHLAYSVGFALVLLAASVVVFNRVERTFMDTV